MSAIYCCLISYFIGSINPSFILGKRHGYDIREKGSGNAGASNALILFGKLRGAICAVFDIFKACGAILLSKLLFPNFKYAFVISASACIIGHIFPAYMNFHGGKGLACLGGTILMFDLKIFLIMLVCALAIAFITDYLCIIPISASFTFSIIYGAVSGDVLGTIILFGISIIILIKHIENIKRIKNGTELHLSFLWNKNKEFQRIQNSGNANDQEMNNRFLKCK